MKELQIIAQLKIHESKLEEFKSVAQSCIKSVQENDSGTLQYDWFLSANQMECVVRERYKDSNAVLEHIGNLGSLMADLLGVADMSIKVFGQPSKELIVATEGMDIEVYDFLGGTS